MALADAAGVGNQDCDFLLDEAAGGQIMHHRPVQRGQPLEAEAEAEAFERLLVGAPSMGALLWV
jgi:hypothetical protein